MALVFQALKPDYELSDEEVKGIFQMSDENNVKNIKFETEHLCTLFRQEKFKCHKLKEF